MIIYKTTNLANGKIYIGQSRFDNPKYLGSGDVFRKAIKKYSKESFKKEILERCETQEQLNEREIYWIEYYKCRDPQIGYNITAGGDGPPVLWGHKHSKETILKMSGKVPWNKGKKLGPSWNKGLKSSDVTKKKMSIKRQGRKPMLGKKHSEAAKAKMSKTRRKLGIRPPSWLGKKHSEATKEKMRAAQLARSQVA